MEIKRVLQLNSEGTYNFWLMFDKMQFENNHVWVFNQKNIVADFQLDGYLLAKDKKIKSLYDTTIFYKLEREAI